MVISYLFACALGIGFVAGLRSMLAPAAVALAAHAGWLHLEHEPLAFMGSATAVVVLSLLAVGELVADKLPAVPRRTSAAPLLARMITGALSGACLVASVKHSLGPGAVLGAVGAIIGAFAGYNLRRRLVTQLHTRDFFVALAEDLIAASLTLFLVSR